MSRLTTEDTENTEVVMAIIKLPVSVSYISEIAGGFSKIAKAEGRTAFARQVGDCIEIYSTEEVFK
jgi:hypothetical protein